MAQRRFRKGNRVRIIGGCNVGRPALVLGPGPFPGYRALSLLDADWDSPAFCTADSNLEMEGGENGNPGRV